MTKCGDLGEISTRNLQLGEIDLKEHTYPKCIETMQVNQFTLEFTYTKTNFIRIVNAYCQFSQQACTNFMQT